MIALFSTLAACTSTQPVSSGPSPVDVQVSPLMLDRPMLQQPQMSGRTLGREEERYTGTIVVSLMNMSHEPRTVSRLDLTSLSDRAWVIQPVRRQLDRTIPAGEEIEVELPVEVRLIRIVTDQSNEVAARVQVGLSSGESYLTSFEIPVDRRY